MKGHIVFFYAVLALVIGLVGGFVLGRMLPPEYAVTAIPTVSADSSLAPVEAGNSSLLQAATKILDEINAGNMNALSNYIDPEEGITFTSYSTVNFGTDVNFSAKEFSAALSSSSDYIWGMIPGDSEPVRMTLSEYLTDFVWDADYCSAPEIGIDTVLYAGNAQENVAEAYPGCRFVDFYIPGHGDNNQDFSSLKLVFSWKASRWNLVGVIHSQWLA